MCSVFPGEKNTRRTTQTACNATKRWIESGENECSVKNLEENNRVLSLTWLPGVTRYFDYFVGCSQRRQSQMGLFFLRHHLALQSKLIPRGQWAELPQWLCPLPGHVEPPLCSGTPSSVSMKIIYCNQAQQGFFHLKQTWTHLWVNDIWNHAPINHFFEVHVGISLSTRAKRVSQGIEGRSVNQCGLGEGQRRVLI